MRVQIECVRANSARVNRHVCVCVCVCVCALTARSRVRHADMMDVTNVKTTKALDI